VSANGELTRDDLVAGAIYVGKQPLPLGADARAVTHVGKRDVFYQTRIRLEKGKRPIATRVEAFLAWAGERVD
jgi:hypothetical protein